MTTTQAINTAHYAGFNIDCQSVFVQHIDIAYALFTVIFFYFQKKDYFIEIAFTYKTDYQPVLCIILPAEASPPLT